MPLEHGFRNTMLFVDDGFSGTNFSKTRISGNDEICGDYSVSTLIVKDLSRLGREYSYMGAFAGFHFSRLRRSLHRNQ